ncbi:MAG: tyrosine-type recombinase/integrase [Patescibacteria group bacterium]|nr:tyrosine-type recombinase/integrase [Patescibacteria group bacterium]
MPRERFQDPTVEQSKNGSYYIRPWVDVITKDGITRRKKTIVLGPATMKQREVLAAKRRVMETINRASYVVQSQIVFGALLDEYAERHIKRQAYPTQKKYESLIKNHIRPAFGELQLIEITAKRVQEWLDAKPKSWSTRNDIRNLMSGIFERATAWKYWQDANPMEHVTAGRKRLVREKHKLTDDETRKVFAALPGQVRLAAMVAWSCTLRISEVLALREKSLEWDTNQIYVQERFHRGDLDVTKNRAAERRVPMGYLADELKKLCMGDPDRFVFNIETRPGKPGPNQRVYICRDDRGLHRYFLRPAAKAAGCYTPGFGWHALRREAVTAFNATLGTTQAMRLAGHSSVAMSAEYTLADRIEQDRAVRERQERLMGETKEVM